VAAEVIPDSPDGVADQMATGGQLSDHGDGEQTGDVA
jgi:hypothetical protein